MYPLYPTAQELEIAKEILAEIFDVSADLQKVDP
jgi:hypothetical protein